ncbi:hypothetical protein BN7_5840 [Wickerhamomyces ciferrii]|uniref:Uncharacterized protein n=1 Tax=Wickerhamomyces ciferrii (strain ATCC 14091 / BCRC 22168 / CBS 111 / JCM 3599 / NBRC 0793 / NRRL Y-1031 F-60-10) TaxID=1206466 RepID=K0KXR2_WICCF|nr:uncharacterized protein BN7_5840 [Wickerhamomyces ciferrii]CCH46249.1 hypothetical protein BN7_5840 [Wickerhamomyces ciferrii]
MSTDLKKSLKTAKFVREILINDIKRIENESSNLYQAGTKDNTLNQKKQFWLENIRPALIRYWKFKRSLFSLIHLHKQNLKSLNEAKEASSKITQKSEHEKTFLGPFPIEIWEMIMQQRVRKEVLRINKTIFNELAPYAFGGGGIENLQLLLVVSSIKKMKQNDACFLREGPDFPDKPCDSYSINERSLESSKFKYEFLDVDYDVPNRIRDGKTLVITNHDEIKFLFNHLIHNPASIIKKSFKSINVDISILHGYKELVYDYQVNRALERYRGLGVGSLCSLTQTKTEDFFYGPDLGKSFDKRKSRWGHPKSGISRNFDTHSSSKVPYNTADEVFPNKVYFNELIHLSELFKSYDSGQRSEFLKISTEEGLQKNLLYKKYVLSPDHRDSPDFDRQQLKKDGAVASHNIKIQRRKFASSTEARSLIKTIVESLSSVKFFIDTDVSLFITSGMSNLQETNEIHQSQLGREEVVEHMYKYIPHFTLLKKPKSV